MVCAAESESAKMADDVTDFVMMGEEASAGLTKEVTTQRQIDNMDRLLASVDTKPVGQ